MRYVAVICLFLAGCWGVVKDEDEARFKNQLGSTTIAVYPAVVRDLGPTVNTTWDERSADEIAAWLNQNGFGKAVVAHEKPPIAAEAGMNQAKMFRSSILSFGEWIKATPPSAEYACVAEYLMMRNGTVGGVHVYFVRSDGTPVFGTLSNSHWKEFKKVKPVSVRDANQVALGSLERRMLSKRFLGKR